jgi:hypothetical protein
MTFLERRPGETDEDMEDRIRHVFEVAVAAEKERKQAIKNLIKAAIVLPLAILCFAAVHYIARF